MADPSYTAAKPGDFFCPRGGTWYACETGTKFVGCCTSDPCIHGCFGDVLRPAGRVSGLANLSPGGSCGGETPNWTCEMAPTFWGCCNEDPCMNNSTCPPGKLEPAFWDRPDQYSYFHDLNLLLSSTVPDPTAFSTASSTSTAASNTPTTIAAPSPSKTSGAVIGGAVGGSLAFLIIIAAVVFFLFRRRRSQKKMSTDTEEPTDLVIAKAELASPITSTGFSPPPTYSWDTSGNNPDHKMAHYRNGPTELLGDTARAEIYSPSTSEPHELHGGSEAGELESAKAVQGNSADDTSKEQAHGLGLTVDQRASALVNARA